jgi:DNA adenine methylase
VGVQQQPVRPFLKWAGNKYAVLRHILPVLPEGKRLIEPFAGSAAVFLNTHYPTALLGDVNPDLINLYTVVQNETDDFIAHCRALFVPEYNQPEAYYALRKEFNADCTHGRRAALFLYLNRHGYNGLCRYNAKGGYNVPFGRYKKPYFPEAEIQSFYKRAARAQCMVSSFRILLEQASKGDVVYCDPPYIPLSATANFTSYAAEAFGSTEQEALTALARKAAARGAVVIISNHDTLWTRELYRGARIIPFEVQRYISRDGENRKKAKELLAIFA